MVATFSAAKIILFTVLSVTLRKRDSWVYDVKSQPENSGAANVQIGGIDIIAPLSHSRWSAWAVLQDAGHNTLSLGPLVLHVTSSD
jgi:hypothetical protein